MYPSSSRILTRLIEFRLAPLPLASSMHRSESESSFLVGPVCVSCSVVVSILANGVQNDGKVSKSVGRELVRSGFMYLLTIRKLHEMRNLRRFEGEQTLSRSCPKLSPAALSRSSLSTRLFQVDLIPIQHQDFQHPIIKERSSKFCHNKTSNPSSKIVQN